MVATSTALPSARKRRSSISLGASPCTSGDCGILPRSAAAKARMARTDVHSTKAPPPMISTSSAMRSAARSTKAASLTSGRSRGV